MNAEQNSYVDCLIIPYRENTFVYIFTFPIESLVTDTLKMRTLYSYHHSVF